MGERISDKKKKKIIADYIETNNYREVARKNKVSDWSVKNIVTKSKDTMQKLEKKKEENTKDVLEYMTTKKDLKIAIIDSSLMKMKKKLEQEDVSITDLIRIYGTLIDKELKMKELEIADKNNNNANEINNNLINIATLINNPRPTRQESDFNE